jgi:hypothetical protein
VTGWADTDVDSAELRRFLARLPEPAVELILDRGDVGYLYELHARIRRVAAAEGWGRPCGCEACAARVRLLELLPPLV